MSDPLDSRQFHPRAFGLLLDEVMFAPSGSPPAPVPPAPAVEGAVTGMDLPSAPLDPLPLIVEGTLFSMPGVGGVNVAGVYHWGDAGERVPYDHIPDLVAKLHWGPETTKAFIDRVTQVINRT